MGASPQQVYAFPHWQPAYHAALIQTDCRKLFELVQAAEKSIFESLQEIADSPARTVASSRLGTLLWSVHREADEFVYGVEGPEALIVAVRE
jgi:hypothetical protein